MDVPVTLKIRTGWAPEHRNCEEIAQLAEDCGIQALTIHGRTRACLFNGEAEYDSIRAVKQKVSIPLSRMVTLLTRLKPELCSTIQGRMPDDRPRSSGKTLDLSGKSSIIWTLGSYPHCLWQRLSAFARVRELHDFMVRQRVPNCT